MKKNIFTPIKMMALLIVILFATNSCRDLFNNPMQDKETGKDLSLLLIDMNFFDTKFNFHFVDSNGAYIDNKEINVFFAGNDAENLVDFNGYKNDSYTTSNGNLELALDPNIIVSEANPIDFTIYVDVDDFSYIGYPKEVTYNGKGKYDVEVLMFSTNITKSANLNPGDEPFDLMFNNVLIKKTGDPVWIYAPVISYQNGKTYYGALQASKLPAGTLSMSNFNGDPRLNFKNWGIEGRWGIDKYQTVLSLTHDNFNVIANSNALFYAATQQENLKCTEGLNIEVSGQAGKTGTGSFNYKIYADDMVILSGIISSSGMPFTKNTGSFYYPRETQLLTVQIDGDSQYTIEPAISAVSSLCGGLVKVTAKAKTGLVAYKISTNITCPGNNIGITPTLNGKFKIKDSTEAWSNFSFNEGICTLMLKPGATYSIEGTIGDANTSFDFPTDESKIPEVVRNALYESRNLENMVIVFSDDTNGKVINISIVFKAGRCPF